MDIRVLRYCEAVARLGTIARAAAEMHVAQPALSVVIRKLEEKLGVTLFTRTRNCSAVHEKGVVHITSGLRYAFL